MDAHLKSAAEQRVEVELLSLAKVESSALAVLGIGPGLDDGSVAESVVLAAGAAAVVVVGASVPAGAGGSGSAAVCAPAVAAPVAVAGS